MSLAYSPNVSPLFTSIDSLALRPAAEDLRREQLEGVANIKMPDLTAADLDAAVRTIAGTARSMGLDVEGV